MITVPMLAASTARRVTTGSLLRDILDDADVSTGTGAASADMVDGGISAVGI